MDLSNNLKGNGVRITSKVPKSNPSGTFNKAQFESPYYSTSGTRGLNGIGNYSTVRRAQSATQSRERDSSAKKQAENLTQRKQSDPTLSMTPTVESKVLHKNSMGKPKSASTLSGRQRKVETPRANSFQETTGSGDAHSPTDLKKLKKQRNQRRLNEDVSTAFDMISHEMSFSEHSDNLSLESNLQRSSGEPGSNYYDDEVLLSESDNLFQDVLSLCNEMGLDPSVVNQSTLMETLRNVKSRPSPLLNDLNCGDGEGLSSIACPPLWNDDSAHPTPRPQTVPQPAHPLSPLFTQIVKNLQELNQKRNSPDLDQKHDREIQSRPVSADSMNSDQSFTSITEFEDPKSPKRSSRRSSNGPSADSYAKILSSLSHIEDEERKGSETAASFGDFLRQKYGSPNSFSPRPRSSTLDRSHYDQRQDYKDYPQYSARVRSPQDHGAAASGYSRGRESSCSARIRSPTERELHYSKRIRSPTEYSDRNSSRYEVGSSSSKDSIPKLPPIDGHKEDVPCRPRILSPTSRPLSRVSQFDNTEFGYSGQLSSACSTQRDEPFSARQRRRSGCSVKGLSLETSDEKSKNLFSYLDEVEKSDREILFSLKYDKSSSPTNMRGSSNLTGKNGATMDNNFMSKQEFSAQTMDGLIRKGSVELAREVIMLERSVENSDHNVKVLEDTLLSQRELNVRNIKCAERDLKKRLKLQQEEFELALSRHQAFVDQLIGEKRALQDKCEKVLKDSKDSEQKYQTQIKSLQEKHMDELKRLRKIQENAEKNRKSKWVGAKTQEIRELTVKGLEPEVQRIITRHQQEMSEMRAWHADELREMEERYARKQTIQLQELREAFGREKEECCRRERELSQKRFESELQRLSEDFEAQKRRIFNEVQDEKDRFAVEEAKFRELMLENVRKAQIKGEVEVDNVREECELKLVNLERRHDNEVRSLKAVYEDERENWITNFTKKQDHTLHERELALIDSLNAEKDKELREREKRLKEDFEKLRREDESDHEARIKRMNDKFQSELNDLESSEKELKHKFSQAKAEALGKEEEIFSLKTTLGLKEKQNVDLSDANMKMLEERAHLTSVIRREFASQIDVLEEECRAVKAAVSELKAKHKHDLETQMAELEKLRGEKDGEIEKIGLRVKQALCRKEETIQELSKQLEKAQIRINHLEDLLEQQRKDFVSSMTTPTTSSSKKKQI